MDKDKRLMEASFCERLRGKLGLVLMGGAMLSRSLIQLSVDGPGYVSSLLLLSVQLFATPWTAARQASLSITNSWSLLKPMSTESVIPSNYLIFCHPSPPTLNLSQHQGLFK